MNDNLAVTSAAASDDPAARRATSDITQMVTHHPTGTAEGDALETLGVRRLLARGAKLLRHYHESECSGHLPYWMLDSEDRAYLSMTKTKVSQVELALGRMLFDGLDSEGNDALCSQVGANLLHKFHADLIRRFGQELDMYRAGDWAGLLLAGFISHESYLVLKAW